MTQGQADTVQPHIPDPDQRRGQQGGDRILPWQEDCLRVQGEDAQEGVKVSRLMGQGLTLFLGVPSFRPAESVGALVPSVLLGELGIAAALFLQQAATQRCCLAVRQYPSKGLACIATHREPESLPGLTCFAACFLHELQGYVCPAPYARPVALSRQVGASMNTLCYWGPAALHSAAQMGRL